MKEIAREMSERIMKSRNIVANSIVLSFLQQFSEQICERLIQTQSYRFVIFRNESLKDASLLENHLKIRKGNTLEWLFSKEELLEYLTTIMKPEWEEGLDLVQELRFLERLVDLLALVCRQCTFDIDFLNRAEQFAIAVSTLYYRKRTAGGYFVKTRQRICSYQTSRELLVVEGVKPQLDMLIFKLKNLFATILNLKQRLYVHPIVEDPQATFRMSYFLALYSRLCVNERLGRQIAEIYELLEFYGQKKDLELIVVHPDSIAIQCLSYVEQSVSDLEGLSIIMESIRIFKEKDPIKENIIATMKLKILSIEDSIKLGSKHKNFQLCSDALALPEKMLQFILENNSESSLVLPLAELLFERVTMSNRLFAVLKSHRELLKDALKQPNAAKYCRVVLNWVGRQVEKMESLPISDSWAFVYEDLVTLIDGDQTSSVYYFISLMLELGLDCPKAREQIYARLIRSEGVRQFLSCCSSSVRLKEHRDELQKCSNFKAKMQSLAMQLILIIRLCKGKQKLQTHLETIAPLKQIKEIELNRKCFLHFLPIISYISSHSLLVSDKDFASELLLVGISLLKEYRSHKLQLNLEHPRSFRDNIKTLGGNLSEHVRINEARQRTNTLSVDQNLYYWQFLYWVPFYRQPEGLLVCLEKVIKYFVKNNNTKDVELNLGLLEEVLIEIRSLEEMNAEYLKPISNQLSLLISLLSLREYDNGPPLSNGWPLLKDNVYLQQICRLLQEAEVEQVIFAIIKKNMRVVPRKASIDENSKVKTANSYKPGLNIEYSSQTQSLQEYSHHSLIRPSKTQEKEVSIGARLINTPKAILSFLHQIDLLLGHRVHLKQKLQILFLKYFVVNGSFRALQQNLTQTINILRDKALIYKEDSLGYPWGWRKVPATTLHPKLSYVNQVRRINGNELVGIQIQNLVWVLQADSSQALNIVYNILITLQTCALAELVSENYGDFQTLLIRLLCWKGADESNLSMVIVISDIIVGLMAQAVPQGRISPKSVKIIHKNLSVLMIKICYLDVRQDNYIIFTKSIILAYKIQSYLLHMFDTAFSTLFAHKLYNRLPKHNIKTIFISWVDVAIAAGTEVYKVAFKDKTSERPLVQFILKYGLLDDISFGNQMINAINFDLLNKVYDYLHFALLVFNQQPQRTMIIPQTFMWKLIKIQCALYQQFIKQSCEQKEYYEELIVSSLGFFHTLSFNQRDKIDLSLFQQRQPYFQNDQSLKFKLRDVYEDLSNRFDWCIIKLESGCYTVHAYPKVAEQSCWKNEISQIMQSFSECQQRREVILRYCLGATSSISKRRQLFEAIDHLRPFIYVASFACISLGVMDQMLHLTSNFSLFYTAMMIQNILILLIVVKQCLMVYRIGQFQALIMQGEITWGYFVKKRKKFIFFSLLLILINICSFWFSTLATIALFQISFMKTLKFRFNLRVINLMMKCLVGLGLLMLAWLFFVTLTIDPQTTYIHFPFFDIHIHYDIRFIIAWMGGWYSDLNDTYKGYLTLKTGEIIQCFAMAFGIYNYLRQSRLQSASRSRCQLCSTLNNPESSDAQAHKEQRHNIFKFIFCFKYIQEKSNCLRTLKKEQIKAMIVRKNIEVFG